MAIVNFPNWVGLVITEKTLSPMEDLNLNDDLSFDDWFDLFQDKARMLGYNGPIDKYSFEWNYEEGETPESAAESFVKEMNS